MSILKIHSDEKYNKFPLFLGKYSFYNNGKKELEFVLLVW